MIDKRIAIIKYVITSPGKAFQEIDSAGRYYFSGAIVILAITGILTYLIIFEETSSFGKLFQYEYMKIETQSELEALYSFAYGFFIVALVYYIGRRLKGSGTFLGLFSTMQYAGIPAIIGLGLSLAIQNSVTSSMADESELIGIVLTGLLMLSLLIPFAIWSFVLTILACMKSHKVSGKRSIGILLISAIILMIVAAIEEVARDPSLFSI